jgi:hypothetical protein
MKSVVAFENFRYNIFATLELNIHDEYEKQMLFSNQTIRYDWGICFERGDDCFETYNLQT